MSPNTSEPGSETLASRLRALRQVRRAQVAGAESSARELVLVAFGLPVVLVVGLAVIVSVTVLAAGGGFGGIGASIGSAWLVVHQVPLTIGGVTLGALPLLPTLLVLWAAVKSITPAIGERRSVYELGALLAAAIGGPLLITALSMAVVMDGQSVLPVQSPDPASAFGSTALVYAVATVIAVARVRWREWASARGLSRAKADDIARGTRLGFLAVLILLTVAAAIIAVMLVVRHAAVTGMIDEAHSFDGYLGLIVISILYLPNLAVAGAGAFVGADADVGQASLSLLHAHGGAIPPLPLLAVLPDGEVGKVGLVGFVVVVAVGVYVGLKCRRGDLKRTARLLAIAGASAALVMVLLTWASTGELGELGSFGASVPLVGVYTFAFLAVVGLVVALIGAVMPASTKTRTAADDEDEYDEDEYDDEYDEGEYEDEDDAEYDDAEYDDAEVTDSGYNEYYVDDFDADDFDPEDFQPAYDDDDFADADDEDSALDSTDEIVDEAPSVAPRRIVRGRGMRRDEYEDVDALPGETEVTGKRS